MWQFYDFDIFYTTSLAGQRNLYPVDVSYFENCTFPDYFRAWKVDDVAKKVEHILLFD